MKRHHTLSSSNLSFPLFNGKVPFGLVSGTANTLQLSSSSVLSPAFSAQHGRLKGNSVWRPDQRDFHPFLQVDHLAPVCVLGVAVQGFKTQKGEVFNVTRFMITSSNDGETWSASLAFKEESADEQEWFRGVQQSDSSTPCRYLSLEAPVRARFLRVYCVEPEAKSVGLRLETIVESLDKMFGCAYIHRSVVTVARLSSPAITGSSARLPSLVDKRGLESRGVEVGPAPEAVVINPGGLFRVVDVEVCPAAPGGSVEPFTIESSEDGVNFLRLEPAQQPLGDFASRTVFPSMGEAGGRVAVRSMASLGRFFRVSQLPGLSAGPQAILVQLRGVYVNISIGAVLPNLITLTRAGEVEPAKVPGAKLAEMFSLALARTQPRVPLPGAVPVGRTTSSPAAPDHARLASPETVSSRSGSPQIEPELRGPFTLTLDVGEGCLVDAVMLEGASNHEGVHGFVTKALIRRVGVDAVPVAVSMKDRLLKIVRLPGMGPCTKVEIEVLAYENWPGLKVELIGQRSATHTDIIFTMLSANTALTKATSMVSVSTTSQDLKYSPVAERKISTLKRTNSNPETLSSTSIDKWATSTPFNTKKSKSSFWRKLFCLGPKKKNKIGAAV